MAQSQSGCKDSMPTRSDRWEQSSLYKAITARQLVLFMTCGWKRLLSGDFRVEITGFIAFGHFSQCEAAAHLRSVASGTELFVALHA